MACRSLLFVLLAAALACPPFAAAFLEKFDEGWTERWIHSAAAKYDGKFEAFTPSEWQDNGIQMSEKSKHYGLTRMLGAPIDPSKGVVLQYEVRFTNGISCGGAYIKLLTDTPDLSAEGLTNDTPYSIMFGPDKCGSPIGKLHLIFRHKSPLDGTIEEKHVDGGANPVIDSNTHVYTLVVSPDNTYKILVDGEVKDSGSLFDDKFKPPFNPPEMIPDPEDKKPSDWVDEAKIPDPAATKPDDWVDEPMMPDESAVKPKGWLDDEPQLVDDPKAVKPDDWDDDEDGDWEPAQVPNPKCKVGCGEWKRPMIKNPKYVGPWKAPMIDNPAYKGPWVQKQIPNPKHYKDDAPLAHIGNIKALAFELWTIDSGYTFDNVLLTQDEAEAQAARAAWKVKAEAEKAEQSKKLKAAEKAAQKSLASLIIGAFDSPALSAVKPFVQPVLSALEATPALAYALFVVPTVLLVVMLLRGSSKAKAKKDAVGKAKKDDTVQPDDTEEEEDEPAVDAAAADAKEEAGAAADKADDAAAAGGSGSAPGPQSHKLAGEIGSASEEDGGEEQAGGQQGAVRRSKRLSKA